MLLNGIGPDTRATMRQVILFNVYDPQDVGLLDSTNWNSQLF